MRSVYREVRQVWRGSISRAELLRRCGGGELRLRKFSSPPLVLSSERKGGRWRRKKKRGNVEEFPHTSVT